MRVFGLILTIILLISMVAGLSGRASHHSYVFHCEGEEAICGGNLSEPFKLKLVNFTTLQMDRSTRAMLSLKMRNISEFNKTMQDEINDPITSEIEKGDYYIEIPSDREIEKFENLSFTKDYRINYSVLNETALVSKATLEDTWDEAPINIEYSNRSLHEPEYWIFVSNFHFYPKSSFEREELKVDSGCHRTKVNKTGDFYIADWQKTFKPWNCVRGINTVSGGPVPVWNINPLSWF